MAVTRDQRHLRRTPCPVCGGYDEAARGKGARCHGFTSVDGMWCHCSRSDAAGVLDANDSGLYVHRMRGSCRCGTQHGPDEPSDVEAVYEYRDEDGRLLYEVVRKIGKRFLQRRPDGHGRWIWDMNDVRRVPYRLPHLLAADREVTVYIVEGERDVGTAERLGLVATTNAGGAGKWGQVEELARQVLADRDVTIISDADDVGRRHAQRIAQSLVGVARVLKVVEFDQKDLSDFVAAGGDRMGVEALVAAAPAWAHAGLAELGDELDAAAFAREERAAIADEESTLAEREAKRTSVAPPTAPGAMPTGRSVSDVLATWRTEGPLVHEPTGIAALDSATGGGPVYGSRWYVLGSPDAGKTALGVQLGHDYARRGIHVGFLAIDEEDADLVTRLAQRVGWGRRDCEQRDEDAIALIGEELGSLPLRFYGGGGAEHTIETAAADLHAWASANTPAGQPVRCALVVDSIQTVTCEAVRLAAVAGKEQSPRMIVTENVRALRAVATRYRLIAMATGEMNRAAYRSVREAEESNDIAAGAESRAIEYSARVLLALRNLAGEADVIELSIAKNKHGRSSGDPIYLSIDRARMTLAERDAPAMPDPASAKDERASRRLLADAARLAVLIAQHPGITSRDVRAGMVGGVQRCDAATFHLAGAGATLRSQGTRNAVHHYLVGSKVPAEVLDLLNGDERALVVMAAAPPEARAAS